MKQKVLTLYRIEALTDSPNRRYYWFRMKQRVKLEDGIELSTICRQPLIGIF